MVIRMSGCVRQVGGEKVDRSDGYMFLHVQVPCICGHEKRRDTVCRSTCGLATFCEELLPLKQNRDYVVLRLQQSTSLHDLDAPQNYIILRFCIRCTYVLYCKGEKIEHL